MRTYSDEAAKRMTEDPLYKLIPRMAMPTIFAQLMTWIYNLTDTFFVSSLGTYATAAVGVNYSLEQSVTLGATLLAVGCGSLISRLLGQKRPEKASNILSTTVFTGILLSIVLMIFGFTNMDWVVNIFGATEECRPYAIDYATYLLCGAPFLILSFILNQTLRSEGSATLAMIGVCAGGLLNIAIDPVFIFVLDQGIGGAAIATSISKAVSCLILLFPYFTGRSIVKMSYRSIRYHVKDMIEILSISASSFLRTALVMVSNTIMNHVAGGFSTEILAAVTVGSRVMKFPFAIIMGWAQGYQPVVGYNWGAHRFDRVRESLRFSSIIAVAGSIVLAALMIIFARPIVRLFTDEGESIVSIGMMMIRFECITMCIHAFGATLNMFYAGTGRPVEALFLSTARQGYCLIPLLFILPAAFGEIGITFCQAGADLLTLALVIPLLFRALHLIKRREIESAEESKENEPAEESKAVE